jgi:hypothetical protein
MCSWYSKHRYNLIASYCLLLLQRAQSAKGKSAEKSPLEETGSSLTADASRLNELVIEQGDLVRKLKSEKASKVGVCYICIIALSLACCLGDMFYGYRGVTLEFKYSRH